MAFPRPSRTLLTVSLAATTTWLIGCTGPTPAPDQAATPLAVTAVRWAPAVGTTALSLPMTNTPSGPAPEAMRALMAEEALVSVEERLQALELRFTGLAERQGPARETEFQATAADLGLMLDQLDIVINSFELGEPAERAARAARTVAAVAAISGLVDRLAALPDGAALAAPLRLRVDGSGARVEALAATVPTVVPPTAPPTTAAATTTP